MYMMNTCFLQLKMPFMHLNCPASILGDFLLQICLMFSFFLYRGSFFFEFTFPALAIKRPSSANARTHQRK